LNARTGSATPANWLRRARNTPPLPPISGAPAANWRKCAPAAPYYAGNASSALSELEALGPQAGEVEAERLYSIASVSAGWIAATVWTPLWPHYPPPRPVRCGVCARWPALPTCSSSWTTAPTAHFQRLCRIVSRCPEAPLCHWRAIWWAYRHRDPAAAQLLRQHLQLYPTSEKAGAAVFYLARLAEKSGDGAAALAWHRFLARRYPNYYYTIVARPFCSGWSRSGFSLPRQWRRFSPASHSPSGRDRPTSIPTQPPPAASNARGCSTRPASTPGPKRTPLCRPDGRSALARGSRISRIGHPQRRARPAMRHIKACFPTTCSPARGAPLRFWRLASRCLSRAARKVRPGQRLDPFLVAAHPPGVGVQSQAISSSKPSG